jgi:hypothetical protein
LSSEHPALVAITVLSQIRIQVNVFFAEMGSIHSLENEEFAALLVNVTKWIKLWWRISFWRQIRSDNDGPLTGVFRIRIPFKVLNETIEKWRRTGAYQTKSFDDEFEEIIVVYVDIENPFSHSLSFVFLLGHQVRRLLKPIEKSLPERDHIRVTTLKNIFHFY